LNNEEAAQKVIRRLKEVEVKATFYIRNIPIQNVNVNVDSWRIDTIERKKLL
jgi:hypothetical protein